MLVVLGTIFFSPDVRTKVKEQFCPYILTPVCGVDGKTYFVNECLGKKAPVQVQSRNACKTEKPPASKSSGTLQITSPCEGESLPVCGEDGKSYASQCLADLLGVKVASQGMCPKQVTQ